MTALLQFMAGLLARSAARVSQALATSASRLICVLRRVSSSAR
jgi:hypothetical protein